jgi:hypothetical protein
MSEHAPQCQLGEYGGGSAIAHQQKLCCLGRFVSPVRDENTSFRPPFANKVTPEDPAANLACHELRAHTTFLTMMSLGMLHPGDEEEEDNDDGDSSSLGFPTAILHSKRRAE